MQITLMGCPQGQPDPGFPETVSQREIGMQEVYQGRFSGSAHVRVKRQQDIEQRESGSTVICQFHGKLELGWPFTLPQREI